MFMRLIYLLSLLGVSITTNAHHAVNARYNQAELIEVEGEVTEVLIRNPHSQISVRRIDDNGIVENWSMATTAVSNMRRWQIDPTFVPDILRYLSSKDTISSATKEVFRLNTSPTPVTPVAGPLYTFRSNLLTGSLLIRVISSKLSINI